MKKTGFSLIEMIVYLAIMTLILVVIVNMVIVIIVSQKKFGSLRVIEHSAGVSLDRLSREIRDASNIDYGKSQFTPPVKLVLDTEDEGGNPKEIEFFVEDDYLKIKQDELVAPLVDPEVIVDNFDVSVISDASAYAVKIELTLTSGEGALQKTETFYSTILLRHAK